MNRHRNNFALFVALMALLPAAFAFQAGSIPSSGMITPDELVKVLRSTSGEKPLLIHVGFHILYTQGHIPGSRYLGPASTDSGLEQLRKGVESLPRDKYIVIYCGCCPWEHCPNVKRADDALHALGFTRVKVLYVANNFGADWIDKGYPVAKGD